jgi:FdhD protein
VQPVIRVARSAWRAQGASEGERAIPEEAAIAFAYDGGTYAVMMGTPQDLDDFALGFSLTEGIIASSDEIADFEIVEQESGIELRIWLADGRASALRERRRHLAGPTGCGLCGIESLIEAVRRPELVGKGRVFAREDIMRALDALSPRQLLNLETRAVHAAAFWTPEDGLVALREDVGRHNALDKLCGALARARIAGAAGMVLVTSRVSVEMVQKAAAIGASVLAAVSAPTALALRMAESAGMTLIAVARGDGFEVFTHPHRICREEAANVA